MYTQVKYKKVTDKGSVMIAKEGDEQIVITDTIIVGLRPRPNSEILKAITGKASQVHLIGGAKSPGLLVHAIADGFEIAISV